VRHTLDTGLEVGGPRSNIGMNPTYLVPLVLSLRRGWIWTMFGVETGGCCSGAVVIHKT